MSRAGRSLPLPVAALLLAVVALCAARRARAIGVNWGTQLSHPLPASTVVRMLQDNGFDRVKLFEAEDAILGALRGSGLQVMVGIPNDMLAGLAAGGKAAADWVAKNVSGHVRDGVDIRWVTPRATAAAAASLHYYILLRFCLIISITRSITSASDTHPTTNLKIFDHKSIPLYISFTSLNFLKPTQPNHFIP